VQPFRQVISQELLPSMKFRLFAVLLALAFPAAHASEAPARDSHSYANTQDFRTTHLALDLRADFRRRELSGSVDLSLDRLRADARELVLDTRDLTVERVELVAPAKRSLAFRLGSNDPTLGAPVHISLPASAGAKPVVRISYRTSPGASGLQWLDPPQTAGKKQPFLYSQSQAVHARSWIPLQDTPAIRVTYEARIRTPPHLLAVMSADNDPNVARDGRPAHRRVCGAGDGGCGQRGIQGRRVDAACVREPVRCISMGQVRPARAAA
jgi:leukotriene-A4 hydrolase